MGICNFKAAEVKRCIEHAQKSQQFTSNLKIPCLYLVHDNGVYLMSNGTPRDIVASETQTSYVAYAINCNPNKDANWHNNSRLLVGGDDFAEVLPIKTSWLEDCDKFEMFNLRVTATTISDRFTHPIKTKKKNVKAKKVVQS